MLQSCPNFELTDRMFVVRNKTKFFSIFFASFLKTVVFVVFVEIQKPIESYSEQMYANLANFTFV